MKKRYMIVLMLVISCLLTGCCLSHKWQDATCTAPKTCVKCNKTEGDAMGHNWVDATCTAPKTCLSCGETTGNPLGHIWTEATCTEAKTCSICGETEGEALGHTWTEATCTEAKTCSVCNEAESEAPGHQEGEWVLDSIDWKALTSTGKLSCKVCGEIMEESTIPLEKAFYEKTFIMTIKEFAEVLETVLEEENEKDEPNLSLDTYTDEENQIFYLVIKQGDQETAHVAFGTDDAALTDKQLEERIIQGIVVYLEEVEDRRTYDILFSVIHACDPTIGTGKELVAVCDTLINDGSCTENGLSYTLEEKEDYQELIVTIAE